MENIILYGMRSTGKSSIWKILSEKINYDFYDLDKNIEKKESKTAYEIVKNSWINTFRNLEVKYLTEILEKKQNKIIALWWWTIIIKQARELILNNYCKSIYIFSSLDKIKKRIEKDQEKWKKRNSLSWEGLTKEIEKIFKQRKDIYDTNYDIKIKNEENLEKSTNEIIKKLNL